MNAPAVHPTDIPGLLLVDLVVHGDDRGWFKENWQRRTMTELGVPDFEPVQQNVSFNRAAGTTRGIHAEPWDKLVTVTTGRAFGAWVDLRAGDGFGRLVTAEIGPDRAVFVPRGVGNAFQTLDDDTTYAYLVNAHWSPDAAYTFLNQLDETVAVPWPLSPTEVSAQDREHPRLADVQPVPPRRTVVLGRDGQLGRALQELVPDATFLDVADVDLTDAEALRALDWSDVETIVNAAAFTAVDAAEVERATAWAVNVGAIATLAQIATEHRCTLVTVSSDYVFDGRRVEHAVDEPVAPLSVYGATKAAAEAVTSVVPRHYVVRTSWVIGDGANFVATMQRLARDGVCPRVVDDQHGRLTTADELAAGILDLVRSHAPYGIHHVTGRGAVETWYDVARRVFADEGRDPSDVSPISTADYAAEQREQGRVVATRPTHSALRLPDPGGMST